MQKPQTESSGTPTARLDCFESIRGLAAFAVFIGHMILGFCPALYFRNGPRWDEIPVWLQIPARFPGKFLWNGELPVSVFFVLSGFVLSLAFFQGRSPGGLSSAAIRRYPRLMLPVAGSILFAFILLQTGMIFNQDAVRHMDAIQGLTYDPSVANDESNNWLRSCYNFAPDISSAFREALWGAFSTGSRYNPVTWTMPIELAGSFLVYAFLALCGGSRNRWVLYGLCGGMSLACGQNRMLDFLFGMALCDLWTINQRTWRRELALAPALALIAVALFVVPWTPASALLIVGATAAAPRLQQLLSTRWLSWLGRVSFSLYLLHMPIFCSLACGLYLFLCYDHGWPHAYGALLASLASVTATLLLAWLFHVVVDRRAITVARWIDEGLFRHAESAGPAATARPTMPTSKAA
jgi:peptidoglycan/LPS O-acetylase OafA/YrhL